VSEIGRTRGLVRKQGTASRVRSSRIGSSVLGFEGLYKNDVSGRDRWVRGHVGGDAGSSLTNTCVTLPPLV
jgi:hypothetical protein